MSVSSSRTSAIMRQPLLQDDQDDNEIFCSAPRKDTRQSDALILNTLTVPLDTSSLKEIGSLRLCLFGFFSVAGGPFGVEPSVQGAGPLLTLLGLIYFPMIWGVPIALVTAELASIFPANGGCAVFSFHAFRNRVVGFLTGWIGTMATIVTQASYMLLIISYGDATIPGGLSVAARMFCVVALGLFVTFVNLFQIGALGSANSVLVLLVLLPFAVLVFISIPGSHPSNWGEVLPLHQMHLTIYVSNMLWNMQGFASMGAIAGEVKNPSKTYVRGTLGCVVLVALNYAIPIMSTTSHCSVWADWQSGYLSVAAATIAGKWMADWIAVSAAVANLSMLLSSLAGAARTLSGMASLSLMPPQFGITIQRTGSPYVSVIAIEFFSVILALAFTRGANSSGFNLLVDGSALLSAVPPIVQLVAFIWLRYSQPELERPFRVPGGWPAALMCLVFPTGLFAYLIATGAVVSLLLAGGCVLLGALLALVMVIFVPKPRGMDGDAPLIQNASSLAL